MTTKTLRPLSLDRLETVIRAAAPHPLLILRDRPFLPTEQDQLAKCILALANVAASGPRFIVIGVAANRELHDVTAEEHAATVAAIAIVGEYIEPGLQLKCFAWQIGKTSAVVISINGCDDPPYLINRDVSTSLRAGDGWIRRQDRIRRLLRRDYERLYARRFAEPMFTGNVHVQFATDPPTEMIRLLPIACAKRPSSEAKEKIQALIMAQELVDAASSQLTSIRRLSFARVLGSEKPYEPKSIAVLRAELEEVAEQYDEHDLRFKFEQQAHPINFVLEVNGDQPIRAATLVVHIPVNVGLEVADAQQFSNLDSDAVALEDIRKRGPKVQSTAASIRISKHFDIVKPGAQQLAFIDPLRVHVDKRAVGYKFPVRYELRARNLQRPIVGKLFIICPNHGKEK